MDQSTVIDIIKKVFESREVIGVTIALVLYINFVSYIARYRKKKKQEPKKRRMSQPKPAPLVEPSDDEMPERRSPSEVADDDVMV